ncbi:hypothetical protein QBC41DRAFT_107676 [Cercophora samala]|uniref:Uncharacterized protein n=1 Tax=Cercophora samala TaxID=330535 RepID=A0AA39ZEG9_9PEZI|nr:hypothetical protein QBC41DRAFT_107676 [Cercophora samala]
MDAQNAIEPASTKPAASPKRLGTDADQPRPSAVTKLSQIAKPELSVKDNRDHHQHSSSSSRPSASGSQSQSHSHSHLHDDDAGDGNSDAETIVLPGKDGQHSPSKVRKIIKHEDKSDGEEAPHPAAPSLNRKPSTLKQQQHHDRGEQGESNRADRPDRKDRGDKADRAEKPSRSASAVRNGPSGPSPSDSAAALAGRKKKHPGDRAKLKDGSSGLSSAPASPPQRRRRSSNAHSKSDSETAPVDSPKISTREKLPKSADKLVPHKRKAPKPESDDEGESRKVRRQRISGSGLDASRKPHLPSAKTTTTTSTTTHHEVHTSTRTRSPSPHSRAHRRSISTHLPASSSNGLSQKKRRVPAPLQSTDYHSDESSASGSPHPRSSKLRSLTTPATAESTISPAKMAPHKKHLDAHGQTHLARACAKGEYENAKARLAARPEDINVADYAGNTPLQIAALNGYDDIVKLLVDAGCNLECFNNEKDTPLLDAVENGHLEVVNILLAAGVNPRKANAYGEEPIARINEDSEHAEEIKKALQEAKKNMGDRRLTSEDHHLDHPDTLSSHGNESPRRSPGASSSIHATGGRRTGTVRANKTSNHLLYMPMDDKTLRLAAARGDEETVTRILQVREAFDDPESMVAAARGGHEMVMQLLLALGKANPDPPPIATAENSEYATPMLAAIGQENLNVIRLLLAQNDFDPTKRYKGETYYEIARRRKGPNWGDEEHILKNAYDEYKKVHKDGSKNNRSPNRREQERDARRSRAEVKDETTARSSHKRKASSPTREPKKSTTSKVAVSPREKRRSSSFPAHPDDQTSPKRGPGRPKKDDRIPTIAISDREASPAGRAPKVKRVESDMAVSASEGEAVKPRRKLMSAKEYKDKQQQQRRQSITSNASSMNIPSSPRDEPEKVAKTEKYHDRTKALKRDESRDRLSVSGESTGKRYRSSATPPHPSIVEKDAGEAPVKRRRLDVPEGKEKRPKPSPSDDRLLKAPAPRESASASGSVAGSRMSSKTRDDDDKRPTSKPRKVEEHARRESGKSNSSENSIHVKSEDPDVEMPDADAPVKEPPQQRKREEEEKKKKQGEAEVAAREARRKEEDKRRKEEEDKEKEREREREKERSRLAEEAKHRAETEAQQRAQEEQRRKEAEEKQRKEDEERRKREEEERKQREQEERRRQEEEERKRREEERKAEEERRRKEEDERKKREEDERLRREQVEREAAEEARRQREEEERKEHERKERVLREEERRRAERAAREAEQRRLRAEQERARLAKLPPLLRWLESAVNPKLPEVAEKFSTMQGVRYDCIRPEANGTLDGREQWLLNTQVALLLGEKDLELSRYTAWTRIPVSQTAKRIIWRLESDRYALTTPSLYELGRQLPDYYEGHDPEQMGYLTLERLRNEAWEKFSAMDMFFVKASDFMFIIPTIYHLRNLKLSMAYLELPDPDAEPVNWVVHQKWRSDPQAHILGGFAPTSKHYMNGELLHEDKPILREASTSPVPFRCRRIPRHGLTAIARDDPAYNQFFKDNGVDGSVENAESPLLPNGVHSSPMSTSSHSMTQSVNGARSPTMTMATAPNGAVNQPISPSSESGPAQARPLVNGIHGLVNGDTA